MAEDRVTVYRFDFGQYEAGAALTRLLRERELDARFTSVAVTIPAGEVEKFHALQRAEPRTFGEC